MNIARNIEYYRNLKGLTKKEMYEKAGISKGSYVYAVNNNSFSGKLLEKLATALEVNVSDLLNTDDTEIQKRNEALKEIEEIKKKLDEFAKKHLK